MFATLLALTSSMLVLGGEIQDPGKSNPPPPPPTSATTTSAAGETAPTSVDENQSLLQDLATIVLSEVLLTIF